LIFIRKANIICNYAKSIPNHFSHNHYHIVFVTIHVFLYFIAIMGLESFVVARGVAKGGALGARAPPLEKKCLEGTKGLKNYLQEQRFSPLACTPLENSWLRPWL
jgi:hypothetical protein